MPINQPTPVARPLPEDPSDEQIVADLRFYAAETDENTAIARGRRAMFNMAADRILKLEQEVARADMLHDATCFTRPRLVAAEAERDALRARLAEAQQALTAFCYVLTRDFTSMASVDAVVLNHVQKTRGKMAAFSDIERATWATATARDLLATEGKA